MSVRAVVFKVGDTSGTESGWTWCFEVDGRRLDNQWKLPAPQDDWRAVLTAATWGVIDLRSYTLISEASRP